MAGNNGSWARTAPYLLSILRIIAAFLFMQHGAEKLFGYPGGSFELISSAKLFTLAPGLAGIIEFGGGFLLLIGLFSRPVAFIMSGEMAFAYFMAHFPHNHVFPILNGGGLAVLFCFTFLYLSAAGPGPLSLDRALRRA
ncbi:MAG TPA: DoxX family protein [Rhodanobacteraceae bacterium]|jgi:putative oxidoreductase|nr:DoxX family protein [Rhodanobacteraceae bacterium]